MMIAPGKMPAIFVQTALLRDIQGIHAANMDLFFNKAFCKILAGTISVRYLIVGVISI